MHNMSRRSNHESPTIRLWGQTNSALTEHTFFDYIFQRQEASIQKHLLKRQQRCLKSTTAVPPTTHRLTPVRKHHHRLIGVCTPIPPFTASTAANDMNGIMTSSHVVALADPSPAPTQTSLPWVPRCPPSCPAASAWARSGASCAS